LEQMIYPVILSGGSGSRLWPLSRKLLPKQLLTLVGHGTLLQQTVSRVSEDAGFAAPVIIANEEHRFIIAEQMRAAGIAPKALLLEPVGRNTAPAVAIAALRLLQDEENALMVVMPSDHVVADATAFQTAVEQATNAARAGYLVTFGIVPERGETGYGYIAPGDALSDCAETRAVARFIEKPNAEDAERYVSAGYLWNSGIFMFAASTFIDELQRLQPDMVASCREALAGAKTDADFIRLDKAAFANCPADSIDYAVMEHTARGAVVPVSMGWSDLGAWSALWEISEKDSHGNVIRGDVVAEQVRNCYLRSEAGLVAAIGIEDLVIVATDDAVMVAPLARAQDVKMLVERLTREGRTEVEAAPTVHRPWGNYTSLHQGDRVQVKHIVVKPGQRLSLQMHHHRAEHWVVAQGTAKVVCGDEELMLSENQSVYIPLGSAHRLENPGKIPLHVIEVQSGSYLGEDDIVRFDDHYGRG
jgi:mannose-1-phosphate guanylyltransferase/mannose-6-phosphate isomerase